MAASFPHADEYLDDEHSIEAMELVKGVITGIRNVRGEMNIPPKTYVKAVIDVSGEREAEILKENQDYISTLAKTESVEIAVRGERPEGSATYVSGDVQVHVLLKGLMDYEKERARIYKEIKKAEIEIDRSQKKLANRDFLNQAPQKVVEEVREKSELMAVKLEKLHQNLPLIEELS
jgi:valyl-tRNA synthetase